MKRILIILILTPLLNGCGTFVARTGWRNEASDIPRFYPASYVSGALLVGPCMPSNDGWGSVPRRLGVMCIGLVDLPFSLVTDTVFLPLDIWAYKPRR